MANRLLGVVSHGLLDPISKMGDDGVETRLPAGATLLPPIGCDAHSNPILQQWATRVSLKEIAGYADTQ